jgi:hypothetical protein
MKTFKNTTANRDSESTVIMFAQAEERTTQISSVYVECDESELKQSRASHLFTQAGVRFFGFL